MKYLRRQDGVAQLLVVALVVVILAAVGFAVWQSQQAKSKAEQAATTPTPSSTVQASSTPAPTTAPGTNVFVVKELGVEFDVPSNIRDLTYVVSTNNGVMSAAFSTNSLIAADKAAGGSYCTPQADAPLGGIDVSSSTPNGEALVKVINGRHLNYTRPQSACSQSDAVMKTATSQAGEFLQALSTARLTN